MKNGMSSIMGLSIVGFLIAFSPATSRAQETSSPKTENPAPAKQQTEKAAPKQANADHTWKQEIEKKHVEFIEWLQKNYPDKAKELLANRDKDPDRFVQQLGAAMNIYEPIQQADQTCPDLAKVLREDLRLQKQRDELIGQIGLAKEEDRAQMVKHLREIVSARFDIIIQKKQMYFDRLRSRLEKLQERIDAQAKELEQLKADKEQSVDQRMKELTEQNEAINWQ